MYILRKGLLHCVGLS